VDDAGNVRIRAPPSAGFEEATKIVLQSHMDVVCSKANDKEHDFFKDPVIPIVEGNHLHADRTTLGADDGIGVAASMALLELASTKTDPNFVHGPLEAVFTVDEETTMGGAENIGKPPFLQSSVLINVDSEEAHSICVGCAGGFEKKLNLAVERSPIAAGKIGFKLHLHSLLGGHTGIDIHKGRANALQVVARLLNATVGSCGTQLLSLSGGNAPNAIPRDATFEVAVDAEKVALFRELIEQTFQRVKKEFEFIEKRATADSTEAEPKFESSMQLDITDLALAGRVGPSVEQTKKMVNLQLAIPHGPTKVNVDLDHAVDTSISFSIVSLAADAGDFTMHVFSRSSFDLDMKDVDARLVALAELSGCTYTAAFNQFPGWDPRLDSPALKQVIETHKALFQKEARVYSVHAGLECGLFKLSYPSLDCVSIGPTIHHAHSPQELLEIDTVAPFYQWLQQSIVNISKDSISKK
ncbi:MAG: beta-Ala-His dipeptidase, partial [Candidatus Pacebacteria bacterium]|nr:beta-Ala-His dipeptidase [Candidatus Paceibacterota bacterium]